MPSLRDRERAAALEALGTLAAALLFALLFWLFLIVTPDQASAECDLAREALEARPRALMPEPCPGKEAR